MRKLHFVKCLLLCMILFAASIASSSEDEKFPDPHWSLSNNLCLECHDITPFDSKDLRLRFDGDIMAICNRCHATISKDKAMHATGMIPAQAMINRMPESYKNGLYKHPDKEVTCYVCHEIKYQCLKEEYYRKEENPRFHRGAPFKTRTEICYNCHDRSKQKKFNPHDQINDEGELVTKVCTYCHDLLPDRRKAKSIRDVTFIMEKYDMLCIRCHATDAYAVGCVTGFESDGSPVYHSEKPTSEMVERMEKNKEDAILPLGIRKGNIFCGTCHNPHELGVQRRHKADVGADSHKRLRISKLNSQLCLGCHDDKDLKSFQIQ